MHNYQTRTVPDELVEEALRLSLWAPNHRLTFPWVYTLVTRETREKLADLAVELKKPETEIKIKATRDTILNPSHLLSLGLKKSPKPQVQHEDFATLACSVQIISLFLWQHGIGTKWSSGGYSTHPKTYEILGLNPEEVTLEGCLMIGHPAFVPHVPERPDASQFIRRV